MNNKKEGNRLEREKSERETKLKLDLLDSVESWNGTIPLWQASRRVQAAIGLWDP